MSRRHRPILPRTARLVDRSLEVAAAGGSAEFLVYHSVSERERLRQAVLRAARGRGLQVSTAARGSKGRVLVRLFDTASTGR